MNWDEPLFFDLVGGLSGFDHGWFLEYRRWVAFVTDAVRYIRRVWQSVVVSNMVYVYLYSTLPVFGICWDDFSTWFRFSGVETTVCEWWQKWYWVGMDTHGFPRGLASENLLIFHQQRLWVICPTTMGGGFWCEYMGISIVMEVPKMVGFC